MWPKMGAATAPRIDPALSARMAQRPTERTSGPKAGASGWSTTPEKPRPKSLAEIQAEEAAQAAQLRQQREMAQREQLRREVASVPSYVHQEAPKVDGTHTCVPGEEE